MVLSDGEIRRLAQESGQELLAPFDESKLQAVSYDITAGNLVRIYNRLNRPIDLTDRRQMEQATNEILMSQENKYHIKPGEYVLVKTRERFCIPADLTAHVRPRTTFTRIGLVVADQHMNPGFQGYLFLGLFNATPNIIDIYPGIAIGQMVFERISGDVASNKLYNHKKDAHYQNEDSFVVPSISKLSATDREAVHEAVAKLMEM